MNGISIDCNGAIVMTSFVFETVRKYQIDSYMNVSLESNGIIFCRTPSLEEKIGNEAFTPGNFIEMFDHKLNKVY